MFLEHTSDDAKPPVRPTKKATADRRPSDRNKKKEDPTVEELLKERHLRVRLVFGAVFAYVAADNGKGTGMKGVGEILFRPGNTESAKQECLDWIVEKQFTIVRLIDDDLEKAKVENKKRKGRRVKKDEAYKEASEIPQSARS